MSEAPLARGTPRASNQDMDGHAEQTERAHAELDSLQRRAYGPDADIAGDTTAQTRLAELEAAHRRHETWDAAVVGRAPATGSVIARDPTGGSLSDAALARPLPSARWWRRRRGLVVFVGGMVVLGLVTSHIVLISQLYAEESTPTPTGFATPDMPDFPSGQGRGPYIPAPDFVLASTAGGVDAAEPNDLHGTLDALGVSRDDLTRYEDFDGPLGRLNIWSGESRFGMTCLFVAVPVQGIRNGFSADACSLSGLDTIVDAHKRGDSLVRFVLRDDRVNVYVYQGAADPNAS
ncbi:hypothetical protein LG299_13080 [Microbacterium lacus]|uniref:hypothetical protein n=1 Tax=Microbacterium lacus TaxID=415217 RepID=UPI00384CF69B